MTFEKTRSNEVLPAKAKTTYDALDLRDHWHNMGHLMLGCQML